MWIDDLDFHNESIGLSHLLEVLGHFCHQPEWQMAYIIRCIRSVQSK